MNTNKIYAEAIANEYSKKEDSKVVALKKLDKKVKNPAITFAYIFGSVFTLIFGLGMCLGMKVIGNQSSWMFILGIIIGIIGIVGVSVNYFLFKKILEKRKEKYASDIILLAKRVTEGD